MDRLTRCLRFCSEMYLQNLQIISASLWKQVSESTLSLDTKNHGPCPCSTCSHAGVLVAGESGCPRLGSPEDRGLRRAWCRVRLRETRSCSAECGRVPRFSYFPRQRKRAEGMPSDLCVISNLYLSPRSLAKKAVSFPGSRLSRALSLLLEFSPLHQWSDSEFRSGGSE